MHDEDDVGVVSTWIWVAVRKALMKKSFFCVW